MSECKSCRKQFSQTQGLCLQKECKNNRRFCGSCYLKDHQMHKHILLNENEKFLQKCTINSKNKNKQQYICQLKAIIEQYEKSLDNIKMIVENEINKCRNQMLIILQMYIDSFNQQYQHNIIKMIKEQENNQQIQKFINKLELIEKEKIDLFNVQDFIVGQKMNVKKIKIISKNSQNKLKQYIQNVSRQILSRRQLKSNFIPLINQLQEKYIQAKQLSQIQLKLQKLNHCSFKKLTILCDTRPHCLTNNSFQLLLKMKDLQFLSLTWTKKLKSHQIIQIIKNSPHLQYLGLPGSVFDKQCVHQLIKQNSQIQQIHLFSDFSKNLNTFTSCLYYMGPAKIQRKQSLQIDICLNMAIHLKKLKTMWIGNCQDQLTTQIFIQMQNRMQDLILGQFDGVPRSLQNQSLQILNKIKGIKILMLIIINNDETDFQQFFNNNQDIMILILIDCQGIRDGSLTKISQRCPNLCKLGLQYCEDIIGSGLISFYKIKQLYLVQCQQVNEQYFIEFVKNNRQLQILSIKGNEWVNDDILINIGGLFNLSYLNVGYTNIKSALTQLKYLTKLKTLNVCGNKINLMTLKTLINNLKGLQKINLAAMNGQASKTKLIDQDLQIILKSLINLTHLAIYRCTYLTDKSLKYISPTIKCIWLQGTRISQVKVHQLKKKGIYVIDN